MSLLGNFPLNVRNQNPSSLWRKEMNQLMRKFDDDLGSLKSETIDFLPNVEIKEKDKSYKVCAEIPGMKESDINVTLRGNNLILEGERKSESKEEKEGYYSSEFNYGSFYRSIPLEEEVNADSVKASYKDGILTVEMDKVKPSHHKTKKIPILKH